jgi:hypothetical protein
LCDAGQNRHKECQVSKKIHQTAEKGVFLD